MDNLWENIFFNNALSTLYKNKALKHILLKHILLKQALTLYQSTFTLDFEDNQFSKHLFFYTNFWK